MAIAAPGANCPATTTPPTRSAPSTARPPPDLRAAWHEALTALGPASGPDVRGLPDGILLHVRDSYPLETAWAQRYFGDELRRVRAAAARDARLAAIRIAAGAQAAERRGQHEQAAEQQVLAASYQALQDAYLDREAVFAVGMAGGADWDAATPHQRLWFSNLHFEMLCVVHTRLRMSAAIVTQLITHAAF